MGAHTFSLNTQEADGSGSLSSRSTRATSETLSQKINQKKSKQKSKTSKKLSPNDKKIVGETVQT